MAVKGVTGNFVHVMEVVVGQRKAVAGREVGEYDRRGRECGVRNSEFGVEASSAQMDTD
jgi:hypothetical protein